MQADDRRTIRRVRAQGQGAEGGWANDMHDGGCHGVDVVAMVWMWLPWCGCGCHGVDVVVMV